MRGAIQAVANFISASIKLIGLPAPKPCAPSDLGISAIATSSHFAGHCWYMMKRFTRCRYTSLCFRDIDLRCP